ncbi:MAG: DUF2442 domain-containing protein [Pseudomonadota bacterium]
MNQEDIKVGDTTTLKSVKVVEGMTLSLTVSDGSSFVVDLRNFINARPVLHALLDEEEFARVTLIEHGIGLEWPCGVGLSLDTLRRIHGAQQDMNASDLRSLRSRLDLNVAEMAQAFGIGKRTVERYLSSEDTLPTWLMLASQALERDPILRQERLARTANKK